MPRVNTLEKKMKNPLVIAVVAGASIVAVAILAGALLLRSPSTPKVDPVVDPIIAAIAAAPSPQDKEDSKVKQAKVFVTMLGTCLLEYQLEVGDLPSDLKSLWELPSDLADKSLWVAKLDKPVVSDPWGSPYEYAKLDKSFKLKSNGPDGKPGTADDIEYKR